MAAIDSITFSITRTSHPTGHICRVDYSYFLRINEAEFEHHDVFNVSVHLFGDDWLFDKHLGHELYDAHVIGVMDSMPVSRGFVVDCSVLNEAFGEDKVFIKIHAVSSTGQVIEAKSETVRDWF
jgi:hypothetical protein